MRVYHLIVFFIIISLSLAFDLKAGVADPPSVKRALQVISSKIENEGKRVELSRFEKLAKISLDTIGWIKTGSKKAALYTFGDSLFLVYKSRPTMENKNADSIFVYQCINFRKLGAQAEYIDTSNLAYAPASEQKPQSILDELMSPFVLVGVLFGGLLAVIFCAATTFYVKTKKSKSKSNQAMPEDNVKLFSKVFQDRSQVTMEELVIQLVNRGISIPSNTDRDKLLANVNENLKNNPIPNNDKGKTSSTFKPNSDDKDSNGNVPKPLAEQYQPVSLPKEAVSPPHPTQHRYYFAPEGENVLGPMGGDKTPKSNIHFFCLEWRGQETRAKVLLTLGELNTTNEVSVYDFSQNRYDRLKGYIAADGYGSSQITQVEPGEATLKNGQWVLTKPVKVLFS
jgi:hypothetical protein